MDECYLMLSHLSCLVCRKPVLVGSSIRAVTWAVEEGHLGAGLLPGANIQCEQILSVLKIDTFQNFHLL